MERHLRSDPVRWLVALAALAVIVAATVFVYGRVSERYVETKSEAGGPGVTEVVTARLKGVGTLKVAELSGTVQATASDVRGMGLLRSDQVVKMPYAVEYFVDVAKIDRGDLTWDRSARTLVVDAPDVTVSPANTDEGRRSYVRTTGLFVSRGASEALNQRTSLRAEGAAEQEAKSPERMAQAREFARAAIASTMAKPLTAAGFGSVRVVVTFPPERRKVEQWDTSRPISEVLANQS